MVLHRDGWIDLCLFVFFLLGWSGVAVESQEFVLAVYGVHTQGMRTNIMGHKKDRHSFILFDYQMFS